jgi:hypothetical protein
MPFNSFYPVPHQHSPCRDGKTEVSAPWPCIGKIREKGKAATNVGKSRAICSPQQLNLPGELHYFLGKCLLGLLYLLESRPQPPDI